MSETRVVVAPDSFKGTMSAQVVAAALAAGVTQAGALARTCPLADGGEGTAAVLAAALGGELIEATVTGPLGEPVVGSFVLGSSASGASRTAVLDTATASGLHLVDPERPDAERATTYGTGQLIAAAVEAGATRILLGVGGSATTDGGAGAVAAIEAAGGLRNATITVLCDVATPYQLAAEVFGPQKGADPDAVVRLTRRLDELAATWPRDPRGRSRTGAAGGLSGALWAVYDADLVSGIDAVMDVVGFDGLLDGATAVLTGEGRLDAQTAQGKVVAGVCRRAAARGVVVWAVVGTTALDDAAAAGLGLAGVRIAGDPDALAAVAGDITAALSLIDPNVM